MTYTSTPTPITTPFDMVTAYAASFGLFAPGLLAARRQAVQTAPSPSQGR